MTPRLSVVVLALGFVACRAREKDVYDTVFVCDPNLKASDCGSTKAGGPMTCFPAGQLGGTAFCAEACDPAVAVSDPKRYVCTASGALLKVCHPVASKDHPEDQALGCPASLNCYRTSLLADEGLCIMMPVCSVPADCENTMRSTCAGTLVKTLSSLPLLSSNLQCLTSGCASGASQCFTNETCVGSKYDFGPPLDDICLPTCDNRHCPPNFTCAKNADWAPGGPNICVPGFPGRQCAADGDCLTGACVDIGVEFKVCSFGSLRCTKQSDCVPFNSAVEKFVCAGSAPGSPGVCTTLRILHGSNCKASSDCATQYGLACFTFSPYLDDMPHGECRLPCDADGRCPSRAGIPHVCLGANHEGGCYPATAAMPCRETLDCMEGLECLTAPPDPRSKANYSPAICTATCATDQDCEANALTPNSFCSCGPGISDAADGSCNNGVGICRFRGWVGSPCERDAQCSSGNCSQVNGTCVASLRQ